MIEFDESIHLECAASDMAFRFIDKQYGRQISERLLYPKPRGRPVGDTNGKIKKIRELVDRLFRHWRGVA